MSMSSLTPPGSLASPQRVIGTGRSERATAIAATVASIHPVLGEPGLGQARVVGVDDVVTELVIGLAASGRSPSSTGAGEAPVLRPVAGPVA
jgi:hypothetical protein